MLSKRLRCLAVFLKRIYAAGEYWGGMFSKKAAINVFIEIRLFISQPRRDQTAVGLLQPQSVLPLGLTGG